MEENVCMYVCVDGFQGNFGVVDCEAMVYTAAGVKTRSRTVKAGSAHSHILDCIALFSFVVS